MGVVVAITEAPFSPFFNTRGWTSIVDSLGGTWIGPNSKIIIRARKTISLFWRVLSVGDGVGTGVTIAIRGHVVTTAVGVDASRTVSGVGEGSTRGSTTVRVSGDGTGTGLGSRVTSNTVGAPLSPGRRLAGDWTTRLSAGTGFRCTAGTGSSTIESSLIDVSGSCFSSSTTGVSTDGPLRPGTISTITRWASRRVWNSTLTRSRVTGVGGTAISSKEARAVNRLEFTFSSSLSTWITSSKSTFVWSWANGGDWGWNGVTAESLLLIGTKIVINAGSRWFTATTNTQTTASILTLVLDDVIGSRARTKEQIVQIGSEKIKRGHSEGVFGFSFGQGQQVFRGEGQVRIRSRSSDTHGDSGKGSRWEQADVTSTKSSNSSSKIRGTGREGTSSNTTILVSKHVDSTISEGQEHLWDVSNRSTIDRIVEGLNGSKNVHLSFPLKIGGSTFVSLDGSRGGSTRFLATRATTEKWVSSTLSSSSTTIGPPLVHSNGDLGWVTSNVEVNTSVVVVPRHSNVDTIRSDVQSSQKLGDEGFELNHFGVGNGRGVIDQNPNIHLIVATATSWKINGWLSPGEGVLINCQQSAIFEGNGANFGRGTSARSSEGGDELIGSILIWGVSNATRGSRGCQVTS